MGLDLYSEGKFGVDNMKLNKSHSEYVDFHEMKVGKIYRNYDDGNQHYLPLDNYVIGFLATGSVVVKRWDMWPYSRVTIENTGFTITLEQ